MARDFGANANRIKDDIGMIESMALAMCIMSLI